MDVELNNTEVRVLGCLIEKELATPDHYPLSLNAVKNACNQKSNRNPVAAYDDYMVTDALEGLKEMDLVFESHLSRVSKYEELMIKKSQLIIREAAVLCVLMLRGPQTMGELKSRTERMYSFSELNETDRVLTSLMDTGFVKRNIRKPGQKEDRFMHCLAGSEEPEIYDSETPERSIDKRVTLETERIDNLENRVSDLEISLKELKQTLEDFKNQFE